MSFILHTNNVNKDILENVSNHYNTIFNLCVDNVNTVRNHLIFLKNGDKFIYLNNNNITIQNNNLIEYTFYNIDSEISTNEYIVMYMIDGLPKCCEKMMNIKMNPQGFL